MSNYISVIPDNPKTTLEEVVTSPYLMFLVGIVVSYTVMQLTVKDLKQRIQKLEDAKEKDQENEHKWIDSRLENSNRILLAEINLRFSEMSFKIEKGTEAIANRDRTMEELKNGFARIGDDARQAKYDAKLAISMACGNPPSNP